MRARKTAKHSAGPDGRGLSPREQLATHIRAALGDPVVLHSVTLAGPSGAPACGGNWGADGYQLVP
jgi:hypothetical protein